MPQVRDRAEDVLQICGAVSAGGFGWVRGPFSPAADVAGQDAGGPQDAIVALRKELAEDGHDHGAATIQWHLGRDRRFGRAVPSVATVHRILQRRGFVTPQPRKRPKGSWCRFEAPAPNEMWQIDATDWTIATGVAKVFNIIDDHSRVACRSRAVQAATGEAAWITFCQAAQRWGFACRGAVGQRAVFLRQAPRVRSAVRSEPARWRDPPDHRSRLSPSNDRQGRTLSANPQEMVTAPRSSTWPRRRSRRTPGPSR